MRASAPRQNEEQDGTPPRPGVFGQRAWPLAAAAVLCLTLTAIFLSGSLRHNDGHLVYTLDDAYIHMAMARNLVDHGVFGITRHTFAFATSSPLWTLLLAAIHGTTGALDRVPLVLNVLFALLSLALLDALLRRHRLPSLARFLALCLFIYVTPLVPMIMTGMEHTMHIAASLALLSVGAVSLSRSEAPVWRARLLLAGVAAVAVATRYESLFLIATLGGLHFLRRRFAEAFILGVSGAAVISVAGFASVAHGGTWLPASLLVKGNMPDLSHLLGIARAMGGTSIQRLTLREPVLLVLVVSCLLMIVWNAARASRWSERQMLLAGVIVATFVHLQFARTGWFHRYEAYLIAMGVAAIAVSAGALWAGERSRGAERGRLRADDSVRTVAVLLLVVLLLLPFHHRAKAAHLTTITATGNIYQQQVQMGRFLRAYYQDGSVAANDVGAINYLADLRCLDLWGLATPAVTRAKRTDSYTTEMIARLVDEEDTRIAIVYPDWFVKPALPADWIPAGQWTIPDNIVCGEDTVDFFAIDPAELPYLVESLRAFSDSLPPEVGEAGLYMERAPGEGP